MKKVDFKITHKTEKGAFLLLLLSCSCLVFAGASASYAGEHKEGDVYRETALAVIDKFQTDLKGELKAALESGGPENAVTVCHDKAPKIAEDIAATYKGVTIKRTSLRTRNPSNQPDEWEASVLESFEEIVKKNKKENKDLSALEASHTENGLYRYMKVIPMQGLCMTCHGGEIDPALKEKINALYPEDKATGFTLDDIRGAFSVSIDTTKIEDTLPE